MIKVDIYFDGACKNVKDSITEPYGYGVAVFINGEYSESFSEFDGGEFGTSNISEWQGCVSAMRIAFNLYQLFQTDIHYDDYEYEINIFSDSQLITRQFNGEYQIKEQRFQEFYNRAKNISNQFNQNLKITWVPREKNQTADSLSKIGLQKTRQGLVSC